MRRFWALLIDGLVLSALLNIFINNLYFVIIPLVKFNSNVMVPVLYFCFALLLLLFYLLQYLVLKNTIGKAILKIVVLDVDGGQLTFSKFITRYLFREISNIFFGLGSIFAITNTSNLAIYDYYLKSNVFYKHKTIEDVSTDFWMIDNCVIYFFLVVVYFLIFFYGLYKSSVDYNWEAHSNIVISANPNLYWLDLVSYEKIFSKGVSVDIVYFYTGFNYREGYIIIENNDSIREAYHFSLTSSCTNVCAYSEADKSKIKSEILDLHPEYIPTGASFGSGNGVLLQRVW